MHLLGMASFYELRIGLTDRGLTGGSHVNASSEGMVLQLKAGRPFVPADC